MIWQVPRERLLLENVPESSLVGEEQREVGGEDAVLDVAQDLPVLVVIQFGKDVVVLLRSRRIRLILQIRINI